MAVFQGSALGYLFTQCYCKDLSLFVPGSTNVQYADDTQIMVSGSKTVPGHLTQHATATVLLPPLVSRKFSQCQSRQTSDGFGSNQILQNIASFGV